MQTENENVPKGKVPRFSPEFKLVMEEFFADLCRSFPEYAFCILPTPLSDEDAQRLFEYCLSFYPQRFFDILNKNEAIFDNEGDIDTLFLPNLEFKALYNCANVSPQTRETLWKYLQLILFRIVGSLDDAASFGECLKMFQNTNMDVLKQKMCDVMSSLATFFDKKAAESETTPSSTTAEEEEEEEEEEEDSSSRPFSKQDAESMHSRLQEMLHGKIGCLAKELAEDLSRELQDDLLNKMDPSTVDATAVLKSLFSNPGKMADIVQSVGGKLHDKMKSGEINQEDILKEATGILGQMDHIPGMGNMKQFMRKFGQMMGGADIGEAMAAAMQSAAGGGTDANDDTPKPVNATRQMREKMRARMLAKREKEAEVFIKSMTAASAASASDHLTPIEEMLLLEEKNAAASLAQSKRDKKKSKKD